MVIVTMGKGLYLSINQFYNWIEWFYNFDQVELISIPRYLLYETIKLTLNSMQTCLKRSQNTIFNIFNQVAQYSMEHSIHDIRPVMRSLAREQVIYNTLPFWISSDGNEEIKVPVLSADCQCSHVVLVHIVGFQWRMQVEQLLTNTFDFITNTL